MKNKFFLFALLSVFSLSVNAKGIEFFQGSFEEAKIEAHRSRKMIFVDFYAVWCAPCKKMAATVFTDSLTGVYMNSNFISLKVDAEKYERELVARISLTGYPTLGFFSSDGEFKYKFVGALDAKNFQMVAKSVRNYESNKVAWEKKNDPNALWPYLILTQFQDADRAASIAGEFLKNAETSVCGSTAIWPVILNYEKDTASRFFYYSLDHFRFFVDSMPGFENYFKQNARLLFDKAVYYKSDSILNEYIAVTRKVSIELRQQLPDSFEEEVRVQFYSRTGPAEMHLEWLNKWIMIYVNDIPSITTKIYEVIDRYGIEKSKKYCENWALKSLNITDNAYTNLVLAYVYRESGDKKKALSYAEEAKRKATPDDDMNYIDEFINSCK